MDESNNFIGYEYRDVSVDSALESLYVDSYENFGWQFQGRSATPIGAPIGTIYLKFKRDRKICNKIELTRLQRQFDSCASQIMRMERSKSSHASIIAFTIGILGTAIMAGATFAYLGGFMILCTILAIPGFLGWILPYFAYQKSYAKKEAVVTPLIESKYDELYEVCEKGNALLY